MNRVGYEKIKDSWTKEKTARYLKEGRFLIDLELIFKIAEEKGIPHTIDNFSNTNIPMTTDFLITLIKNNIRVYLTRTVKPSKDLEEPRIIEKFKIERENRQVEKAIQRERESLQLGIPQKNNHENIIDFKPSELDAKYIRNFFN
ncbi:TnsA endonuclease N-terminal domain-containing protein [Lysinibacillus sp. NPDC097231]|uniref:TnsA endonuclease N-terminal domain-containing protein n=1 Tax=Lysinibacillus sp. NPDC097231 TaxID=3364142 RepID=UPI003809CEE3